MADLADFIVSFTTAVDFQEEIELKGDTRLADLPEWDSLAALGVIIMFDSDYGLTVTGDDLKKCATVQDIFALIQAKGK
jgi:acyl carrier protein